MNSELRGVCPIVDTPFTPDGHVDYDSLEGLVTALGRNGCHALALFGYASEFYKLDETEREQMTETVVEGVTAVPPEGRHEPFETIVIDVSVRCERRIYYRTYTSQL